MFFNKFPIAMLLLALALSSCEPQKQIDYDKVDMALKKGSSGVVHEDMSFECKEISLEEYADKINRDPMRIQNSHKDIQGFYYLKAKGFPIDSQYSLFCLRLDGSQTLQGRFVANERGKLVSKDDPTQGISNQLLMASGFMNGESISFVLISEDKDSYISVNIIPNPIEATWSNGSRSQMKLNHLMQTASTYSAKISFPVEKLTLTLQVPKGLTSRGL